jgi:hypothetical protein
MIRVFGDTGDFAGDSTKLPQQAYIAAYALSKEGKVHAGHLPGQLQDKRGSSFELSEST